MKLSRKALAGLSKEEKLRLLDMLDEKARREKRARPSFAPEPAQLPIIRSDALEKYLFCGNGFGKTCLLVNWIHWAATGYNPITKKYSPVPSVIYLVVDDPVKIEQKIIPEYRKWFELTEENIKKDGKPHPSRFLYDNGSVCHILTHEVNLLKLEGVEMTHLAFDEPPPRHVFQGLYRGGRVKDRPLEIFMAGTPLYQPWLRTDIYEPWVEGQMPGVDCFLGSTEDNSHINPEEYIKRFGRILTEEEKRTRFHGAFADLSGQALAHLWKPSTHIIPKENFNWGKDWPTAIAIDPHPSKAHFAILLGCDPDNQLVVLDEYSRKALTRDFITDLIERGWFKNRVIDIVYDSLGSADSTSGEGFKSFGKVTNEVLSAHGIGRARATTYDDKSDEDFVERIQEALHIPEVANNFGQKLPKLRVLEGCKGIERDIRQCQWQRDKRGGGNKPKLDISNKDYLACLKYALATNLFFDKPRKMKPHYQTRSAYGMKVTPSNIRGIRRMLK